MRISINASLFGATLCGVLLLSACSLLPGTQTNTAMEGTTSIAIVAGEKVTDELGEYSKLKLDEGNPLLTFDKNAEFVDMASIESAGFTAADAEAAQKAAVSFVLAEMFDNASADIPTTASVTVAELIGKYASGDSRVHRGWGNNTPFIYVQPDGVTFVRDGKPRISAINTKMIEVSGGRWKSDGDRPFITVSAVTITDYRVSPSSESGNDYKTASVETWWSLMMVPENATWKIYATEINYDTKLVK